MKTCKVCKVRDFFMSILALFVAIGIISTLVNILIVQPINRGKVIANEFDSISNTAYKLHQDLNIYIRLDISNSICSATDLAFEKKNICNNGHAVPGYDNNQFIVDVGDKGNYFEIDKINISDAIRIGMYEYDVFCVKPDGKVYIVTSMKNGIDTSMKPLDYNITISLFLFGQNPLIYKISHSGIHKVYVCESN